MIFLVAFLLAWCPVPTSTGLPNMVQLGAGDALAPQEPAETAQEVPPAFLDLVKEIDQLEETRSGLSGAQELIAKAQEDRASAEALFRGIQKRYRSTQRRMDAAGLSSGMGEILRRDAAWLPDPGQQARVVADLRERLSAAQIQSIDLEESVNSSMAAKRDAEQVLAYLGLDTADEEWKSVAQNLLNRRKVLVDALEADLGVLVSTLSESLALTVAAGDLAVEYRAFIEKKVLWVRSSSHGFASFPMAALGHLWEFFDAIRAWSPLESWRRADLGKRMIWLLGLLSALLVVSRRKTLHAHRRKCNQAIGRHASDGFRHSVKVLLITLALAAPWPLLLWVTGSFMKAAPDMAVWTVGVQLCLVGWVWYVFRILLRGMDEEGLVRNHFHWDRGQLNRIQGEIRFLEPIALLSLVFAFPTGTTVWDETLGRLGLACLMAALSIFGLRVFRGFRNSTSEASAKEDGKRPQVSMLVRALPMWQAMAVILPLALCIAAITGYVFTAEKLAGILAETILFVLFLFLVQGFLLRWLKIARLRLAVSQAVQAQAAKELAMSADSVEGKADSPALDLEHLDIPSLDAKTRQLFRSAMTLAAVIGLFLLWRSVLPAIGDLNRFEVWPQFGQVLESEVASLTADPGVEISQGDLMGDTLPTRPLDALLSAGQVNTEAGSEVLTLDELLLALVLLFVTLLFARNIPALLELAVLQRLPLDNGTRYAVTTVVRYLVLLIGLGMASGALGVGWQQVQWLAAALTFGLAFGLQEIFANFVSGLIILFERPIRVGDFVTVGDKEGRVLQLRMRATTIQDWDRREMLVPNKEFITQRITNWTLSDPVTRIVIPVGIAYGSDTELARRTLMACADEEPLVMKTPPPHAVFRAFGESSLDFQLRVFIESPDNWPAMVDHMHQRIDQAFREHNIVIAFPQRDVHLGQAVQGMDVGHGPTAAD